MTNFFLSVRVTGSFHLKNCKNNTKRTHPLPNPPHMRRQRAAPMTAAQVEREMHRHDRGSMLQDRLGSEDAAVLSHLLSHLAPTRSRCVVSSKNIVSSFACRACDVICIMTTAASLTSARLSCFLRNISLWVCTALPKP